VAFTRSLPAEYQAHVTELGLEGVVEEVGYLARPEFAALLQNADLLLAINYDGFSTLIPGKIYEYWAVGGPPIMLLSQPGAAEQLLARYQLGVTLDPRDSDEIAAVILDYYRQRQAGQPVRISRDGIQDFDRSALADKLAAMLDSVLTARAR
jgi:glycosyltransferase involved in cell wall biosynthesis